MASQEYILGDNPTKFTHNDFTVDPSYCPLDYFYTIPELTNSGKPITIDQVLQEFTLDYIFDDSPVTEGPLEVTITARSTSKYQTENDQLEQNTKFDVTFKTPCDDQTRVVISASPTLLNQDYIIFAANQDY